MPGFPFAEQRLDPHLALTTWFGPPTGRSAPATYRSAPQSRSSGIVQAAALRHAARTTGSDRPAPSQFPSTRPKAVWLRPNNSLERTRVNVAKMCTSVAVRASHQACAVRMARRSIRALDGNEQHESSTVGHTTFPNICLLHSIPAELVLAPPRVARSPSGSTVP